MAVREIQPTEYVDDPDVPVIFLAGPIQGAPNWQARAIDLISDRWATLKRDGDLYIANPRRGEISDDFVYADQVAWEKEHLRRAACLGSIIFWFAKQDPSEPYEAGRPYAKTTFGELNRVCGWLDYDPDISVVLGQEPGYTGTSDTYVRELAVEKELKVYDNLEFIATLSAIALMD